MSSDWEYETVTTPIPKLGWRFRLRLLPSKIKWWLVCRRHPELRALHAEMTKDLQRQMLFGRDREGKQ